MKEPVIGITASVFVAEGGPGAGAVRLFAGAEYVAAVARAGGCPVVLPGTGGRERAERHLDAVDGVVLTGGGDVDPWLYGEEPRPGLGRVWPERDEYELALVRATMARGVPVLGICRGLQVVNVALGGTLLQDLAGVAGAVQHWQDAANHVEGHTVTLAAGSLLQRVLGQERLRTNSFHHQAVRKAAPGLTVSAWTADGMVEGLEDEAGLVLAVQWHPEGMADRQPAMLALFAWLVAAARGGGK